MKNAPLMVFGSFTVTKLFKGFFFQNLIICFLVCTFMTAMTGDKGGGSIMTPPTPPPAWIRFFGVLLLADKSSGSNLYIYPFTINPWFWNKFRGNSNNQSFLFLISPFFLGGIEKKRKYSEWFSRMPKNLSKKQRLRIGDTNHSNLWVKYATLIYLTIFAFGVDNDFINCFSE